jgi:hypothetical protein
MVLSIHSSAAFRIANGWPKVWPPVQLPPPSPLSAAAASLWAPGNSSNPGATATAQNSSLYSTQLNQGTQAGSSGDTAAGFQMAFIDHRIALIRFDASQEPAIPQAVPQDNVAG